MSNLSRINPIDIQSEDAARLKHPVRMDGGYRSDVVPWELEANETPYVDAALLAKGHISRDYECTDLGEHLGGPSFDNYVVGTHWDGTRSSLFVGTTELVLGKSELCVSLKDALGWSGPFLSTAGTVVSSTIISMVSIQDVLVGCFGGFNEKLKKLSAGAFVDLSADAPWGRGIFSFEDYLIVYGSNGNPMGVAWCANGDITDWTGGDSGELLYVSGNEGPIDPFTFGVNIGNGVGALFRAKSIARVLLTGNVLQSIGVVRWIDGVGCTYPETITTTPLGVAFVSQYKMPCIVTQSGEIVEIGASVYTDIQADTINAAHYVPKTNEYWIYGAAASYIIELSQFTQRKFRARKRTDLTGVVAAGEWGSDAGYAQAADAVMVTSTHAYKVNPSALSTTTGKWRSKPLNDIVNGKAGTITMVQFSYWAAAPTSLTLKISGDGGTSWHETKVAVLSAGAGELSVATGTTGNNLCVQFELDTAVEVRVYNFQPVIIERGSVEYV